MDFRIIKAGDIDSYFKNGVFRLRYCFIQWVIILIFASLPILGIYFAKELGPYFIIGELSSLLIVYIMPVFTFNVKVTLDNDLINVYHRDKEVKLELVISEDGYYDYSERDVTKLISYYREGKISYWQKYKIYNYVTQVLMALSSEKCKSATMKIQYLNN